MNILVTNRRADGSIQEEHLLDRVMLIRARIFDSTQQIWIWRDLGPHFALAGPASDLFVPFPGGSLEIQASQPTA